MSFQELKALGNVYIYSVFLIKYLPFILKEKRGHIIGYTYPPKQVIREYSEGFFWKFHLGKFKPKVKYDSLYLRDWG